MYREVDVSMENSLWQPRGATPTQPIERLENPSHTLDALRAAEEHAAFLQSRLLELEHRCYQLSVDRDALRRQVDQLTYQLFAFRGERQTPAFEPTEAALGKRRFAAIDARTMDMHSWEE